MRVIEAKAKLWAAIVCFGVAACVPAIQWVTPKGQPLNTSKCLWEVPNTGSDEPSVCRARQIKETHKDIAQCKAEGGEDFLYSVFAPGLYACHYPSADTGTACNTRSDCEIACDAVSHKCRAYSGLGATIFGDGQIVDVVE